MQRHILLLATVLLAFAACKKESSDTAAQRQYPARNLCRSA